MLNTGAVLILSTACALFAGIALWCVVTVRKHVEHIEREAKRIANARARIQTLESSVDAVERSYRKLAGTVYRERAERRPRVEDEYENFDSDLDSALAATLALQQRGAIKPQ